ncbi:MAG: putative Ig domain-containing protein [Jatrophihabitans sp.]|uniref:putative Ig domain-containing protein n=1 Tax=Jatrophihabitans sp. TaxID=1932789 RepID=UPI003F7E845E
MFALLLVAVAAIALCFVVGAPTRADAATYRQWTMQGVTFDDGGAMTGTVTFDGANHIKAFDLTTSGGTLAVYLGASTRYDAGNSHLIKANDGGTISVFDDLSRYIELVFPDTSTAATGDSVALSTSSFECTNCGAYRNVASGSMVAGPALVTLSPGSLPDATGGVAYSQTLTASGATGPYSFAVTSGTLPTGLTLTSAGALAGTPSQYGSASFTVTATDSDGISADQAYTLTVASPTVVLPSTLSAGTFGTAYSQSVAASGGTAPYAYAVSAGTLPDGLTLDAATGALAGTPTAAGTFNFTVRATDSGTGTGPVTGQQAYTLTIGKATPPLQVTAPSTGVVGQAVTASVSGSASGLTVTTSSGSPSVCTVSGTTVTLAHVGSCEVDAAETGDANRNAVTASTTVAVGKAATTTSLAVHQSDLAATVSVNAPGAGTPSGFVIFYVDGLPVGLAPLSGSTATLAYSVPSGAAHQVGAAYSGDADFLGSSASSARHNPTITARVSSPHARTAAGWYRSPITVTFTCTAATAPLTAPCSAPVTLSHDGAGQSVSRTIAATDGGMATVSVTDLNLDQHRPSVRVTGIRNGATYGGQVPTARCVATDTLSGIASCRITRHTSGARTSYVATATDRAGNTASLRGSYSVPGIYLLNTPYSNGTWQVQLGRNYTIVVSDSRVRPYYVDAAPVPQRPHGVDHVFRRIGANRWALTVTIERCMGHDRLWNLGVVTGRTLHSVRVHTR